LLLPCRSPSRDGISSYKFETRLIHHGSGGLFIGTNKSLFALMNAAPAELLHLLVNAALQPIWSSLRRSSPVAPSIKPKAAIHATQNGGRRGSFRYQGCEIPAELTKKNAGNLAGVGILMQKGQLFFRRKRCPARQNRTFRRSKKR
jgi:hypothetical protein